jgi:hypothetical protein
MSALDLIAAERARQIEHEGYDPTHDSTHSRGELAAAASWYAQPQSDWRAVMPWPRGWRRTPSPEDRIRELVKAGALVVAEIERLERCRATQETDPE